MNHFTPTRPAATRLTVPLPQELRPEDRRLYLRASRPISRQDAAQAVVTALNLAVPSKAQALTGYLSTLRPNQPTVVITRNALETRAAIHAAAEALAHPTTDHKKWWTNAGTLVVPARTETPNLDISPALYMIFLGRPLRRDTLRQIEAMATANGHSGPPHIVHLVATPSIDQTIANILLAP